MQSGTSKDTIRKIFSDYLTGNKSDGLIFLEHEVNQDDVEMFIEMYPQMVSNGWKLANIVNRIVMLYMLQPAYPDVSRVQ
jgi:chitin deacetylase